MFTIDPPGKPPLSLDVAITVGTLKRVKALIGIDLTDLTAGDPPLIARLTLEEMLICDVLYCVCKPQLDAAGITDEVFGQSLGGAALAAGYFELDRALEDFFQKSGRTEKAAMIRSQRKATQAAISLGTREIDNLKIPNLKIPVPDFPFGNGFTNLPVSSESIPNPSPSESLSGCVTPAAVTNGTAPA